MFRNEAAAHERVSRPKFDTWWARVVHHRFDGLLDEPRPGAPLIDDGSIDEVLRLTLETMPAHCHAVEHEPRGECKEVRALAVQGLSC